MTPDELSERLWQFAARAGKVVDALPNTRLGRHIAGQLVRCGTSAPPNYDEGRAAESRADFVHKLGIALKELKNAGMASFHHYFRFASGEAHCRIGRRMSRAVEHSGSFSSHSEIEASAAPRSTVFGPGLKCPIFN